MPQLEAQKINNNNKFISTVDRQLKEFTRSIFINNNTYSSWTPKKAKKLSQLGDHNYTNWKCGKTGKRHNKYMKKKKNYYPLP